MIQHSQMQTEIAINLKPFAEGGMRYAFFAFEQKLGQKLVAKLPKELDESEYNLETMSKDLETMYICQHIVNEFNNKISQHLFHSEYLLNFVHTFIY